MKPQDIVIDDGALTWNYQDCLDSIWLELIQALNRRCEFIGVEMSVTSDRETRDRDYGRVLGLRLRHARRDREE